MSSSDVVNKAKRKLLKKRKRRELDKQQSNNTKPTTSTTNNEYVPLKKRRLEITNQIKSTQKSIRSAKEEQEKLRREQRIKEAMGGRDTRSLIDQHKELVDKGLDSSLNDSHLEEQQLLRGMEATQKAFITHTEAAKGITYNSQIKTTWRAPYKYRIKTQEWCSLIREKYNIQIQNNNANTKNIVIPPPICKFKHMRFPPAILRGLADKNIKYPTPIQMQAMPVVLSGHDCIGIAYTGSGKTLIFALPMIMFALEEQLKMPLCSGEGPIGIIICPSRELAAQTYENICYFTQYLEKDGWPKLHTMLCMGGIDMRATNNRDGIHMIVATPGRLKDCLEKKKI